MKKTEERIALVAGIVVAIGVCAGVYKLANPEPTLGFDNIYRFTRWGKAYAVHLTPPQVQAVRDGADMRAYAIELTRGVDADIAASIAANGPGGA